MQNLAQSIFGFYSEFYPKVEIFKFDLSIAAFHLLRKNL